MKRDRIIIALAFAAIIALAIPSMIQPPSLDAEIRGVLGDLHAARSNGKPIGKTEIVRPGYIIAIDSDGRASVRVP